MSLGYDVKEETREITPLLNEEEINRSSNEVVFRPAVNVQDFSKRKGLYSKNNGSVTNDNNNDMEETNNNTINKTPPLLKYNSSMKKPSKDINITNESENKSKSKLNKYLLQTEKSKVQRKESPFLVPVNFNFINKTNNKKERVDRYGVKINKKNRKRVRVTFCDKVFDKPLEDVVNVESYKKYNVIKDMPKEDFIIKAKCECCLLF